MNETIPVRWKITRDLINSMDDPVCAIPSRKGWEGPRNCDQTLPLPIRFRLRDGDGEVYYYGLAANEESLDYAHEFGTADAGAVDLQVRENGTWVSIY